jgi:acid phosphatase type 7
MVRILLVVTLGSALVAGCGRSVDPSSLPRASDALVEVGKRLGKTLPPESLTTLGEIEGRLVAALNTQERQALGRAYLRFRVDRPVEVDVAIPGGRVPFWLGDAGFAATGRVLSHPEGPFRIWSRRFPAGTVGLGVNALDRNARGHYTVFVRSESGTPTIEGLDPSGWNVTKVSSETSPYVDDARPFASIPPDLRGSLILKPRREWSDSTALVRGKIWKTRVPSSPTPDQIVVSFGADPRHMLVWSWRTDPSVHESAVRIERVDGTGKAQLSGDVIPISSDGLLNDPVILRHRVYARDLEPDTVYRYAVGDGSADGWSPWQTVRTAPDSERDYAFMTMGDPQCGLEEWGKLLSEARRRRPDAGFLVIAGDLVDRGNERTNWDHFFLRAAGVFEGLPLMPCVGNHEYLDKGPEIFGATFPLPRNGPADERLRLVYSFEYSDSFVAVLDSNPAVYSAEMARVQAEWLDARLATTKARWKFVVFHHPVYASHTSREQPQLGKAWIPIFDKHHVDMVLQGHDHAYLRTYPMREGSAVSDPGRGTVYVVSVSGQKFVPLAERSYTARGFADVATYQIIDISPRKGVLLYRAFDVDGRELDRLELAKPLHQAVASRSAAP